MESNIPDDVKQKIKEEYPNHPLDIVFTLKRMAAEFGYNLAQKRIAELESGLTDLIKKAESTYDVTDYPADGTSEIEIEIKKAQQLLAPPTGQSNHS